MHGANNPSSPDCRSLAEDGDRLLPAGASTPGAVDAGTWRATFARDAMTSADGFGTGDTPWRAVQRAAWDALTKQEDSRCCVVETLPC